MTRRRAFRGSRTDRRLFHVAVHRPPVLGATDETVNALLAGRDDEEGLGATRVSVWKVRNGRTTLTEALDLIATDLLVKDRAEQRRRGNEFLAAHPDVGTRRADGAVHAKTKVGRGLIEFYRTHDSSPHKTGVKDWLTSFQYKSRATREMLFEDMDSGTAAMLVDHDRNHRRDRWLERREWHADEARYNPFPIKVYDPIMALNHRMSEDHESDLSERLGARRVRGSGSQWKEKMDVRKSRFHERFAFAVEAKATLGKSISLTRARIEKAEEQANAERPMFAFRFYGNERLTQIDHDWVATRLDDHEEMVAVIDEGERLAAFVKQAAMGLWDSVLVNGAEDLPRLIEASKKECSGAIEDDHGVITATCKCGWRYEVPLGATTRDGDEKLGAHLAA